MNIQELLKEWTWQYSFMFTPKDNLQKDKPEKLKQIENAIEYIVRLEIERYLEYLDKKED